ncbi:eukaryotic membrane protein family-domain-containing protein, partial [Pyronema domesticum]
DAASIALERLTNFFTLPPKLEVALTFGVLACLDSWLYIFTILPLRFLKAVGVLMTFWRKCVWDYFFYDGNKLRKRGTGASGSNHNLEDEKRKSQTKRRSKARNISGLNPNHKADILRGAILFTTCWFLMRFDASKMYHSIRGQSGIKLYVIYNMLDFGDKLCAALGQDIFDVLFSRNVLDRRPDGRSKIWRPFGFFILALIYNIAHSLVLFYQVITLNVAVNSYSNALLTLLLSVQFVEIKTTVFKKFEKENLFQLLCADIVERFQLLLMLIIIASRNLVELGVWSLSPSTASGGILPKSFTVFPKWTGQVMGPFFMVLGSEMLVDWIKHAYISKFNNTRPIVYERFLDVQCKDYYSRAFADQNLTKRLGLPVLPLASLFIRATIQTYHQFLATHVPSPLPPTTGLGADTETSAALASIDSILRRALSNPAHFSFVDTIVAAGTMCFFLLSCFLVFLAVKLLLGIILLGFARNKYKTMKERERMYIHTGANRSSAFGTVTIGEEERKVIYSGELQEEGRKVAEFVRKGREREMKTEMEGLEEVERYKMCAKRIW